jgi:hypothetical protein
MDQLSPWFTHYIRRNSRSGASSEPQAFVCVGKNCSLPVTDPGRHQKLFRHDCASAESRHLCLFSRLTCGFVMPLSTFHRCSNWAMDLTGGAARVWMGLPAWHLACRVHPDETFGYRSPRSARKSLRAVVVRTGS